MNVRPIIIESNRELAYRELIQSEISQDATSNALLDNFPNNTWKTSIDSGLEVVPGDTIQLDSAMINSIGGGGEVLEFSGFTGLKNTQGEKIVDNKMQLSLTYYVSNNQQNNFNLPKTRFSTQYDERHITYGGPAFYSQGMSNPIHNGVATLEKEDFYIWERSYPYQYIEGSRTTVTANATDARSYDVIVAEEEDYYLPSHSKTCPELYKPNNKRLYIGVKDYCGPYRIINQKLGEQVIRLTTPWDYYTRQVSLSVKDGFTTPSALGSVLTGQLHNREGDAIDWDVETIEAKYFKAGTYVKLADPAPGDPGDPIDIDAYSGGTGIQEFKMPAVTDQTMLTFPNCTGKMCYRATETQTGELKHQNGWNAWFSVGIDTAYRGDEYSFYQGISTYYQNIMTARPKYLKAGSLLNQEIVKNPAYEMSAFDANATLWTGRAVAGVPLYSYQSDKSVDMPTVDVGAMGAGLMVMDFLPFKLLGDVLYWDNVLNDAGGTLNSAPPIEVMDFENNKGTVIPTNMIWNETTLDLLQRVFDDYYELKPNTEITEPDINNPAFLDAHVSRVNFGRIDDQQTIPNSPEDDPKVYPYKPVYTAPMQVQYGEAHGGFKYEDSPYQITGFAPPRNPLYCGYQRQFNTGTSATGGAPAGAPYQGAVPATERNYISLMGAVGNTNNLEIFIQHYLPPSYTVDTAKDVELAKQANLSENRARSQMTMWPPASRNISYEYVKNLYKNIPKVSGGAKLAIVPVWFKDGGADYLAVDTDNNGEQANKHAYVGFIQYDRTTWDDNLEEKLQAFPLPCAGEYFGFSTSEHTNQLSQLCTTQKCLTEEEIYLTPPAYFNAGVTRGQYPNAQSPLGVSPFLNFQGQVGTSPMAYMPFTYVGANDSAIEFGQSSRFALKQFHTPLKKGNGVYQASTILTETEPQQNIISWTNYNSAICSEAYGRDIILNAVSVAHPDGGIVDGVQPYNRILSSVSNQSSISTQGGIGLNGLSIVLAGGGVEPLTPYSHLLFTNTLFQKMGFIYEQLFPVYGLVQNNFNRGNYNKAIGYVNNPLLNKQRNIVMPITTNAYISSAVDIAQAKLSKNVVTVAGDGSQTVTSVVFAPSENLGASQPNNPSNTNAISDELQAINLPAKLDYPYLVLYSDIVRNPDYFGGPEQGQKLHAIAYLSRNYSTGDYYFSSATNFSYTVDEPYVITSITSDIRLPDGTTPLLGPKSAVIYKVLKSSPAPALPDPPK